MNQETPSSRNATLLTFFVGAAVGAIVVALTTPKKGSELREGLACLGRRVKGKIGNLTEQGSRALEAFNDGALEGQARGRELGELATEAWQDVKRGASRASAELNQGLGEAAKELRG